MGYSVVDVIRAVERASGAALPVTYGPRREGDPAAIVAGAGRVREVLGWQPRYDNLDLIVKTALNWERKLAQRNATGRQFRQRPLPLFEFKRDEPDHVATAKP
jgi:UDP-glucose 4-epimerase